MFSSGILLFYHLYLKNHRLSVTKKNHRLSNLSYLSLSSVFVYVWCVLGSSFASFLEMMVEPYSVSIFRSGIQEQSIARGS